MDEIGLFVDYDGKKNTVYNNGEVFDYPIGEMICEYARIQAPDIKPVIMSLKAFSEPVTTDLIVESLMEFMISMREKFGIIASIMVTVDFSDFLRDLNLCTDAEYKDMIAKINDTNKPDPIRDFILEDTNTEYFNKDTVGAMFLTAYRMYADVYVIFKYSFNMLVTNEARDEESARAFWSLYGENAKYQKISFKIINIDDKFRSLYTIKSSFSLLLFEAAHVLDNNVISVKCKNCESYFIPEKRTDTKYCNHISPQDSSKTCKEIGAQITRANKEKSDAITREYRRVYMKLKMMARRNPEASKLQDTLDKLVTEAKDQRRLLSEGTISDDDFLQWLKPFDSAER